MALWPLGVLDRAGSLAKEAVRQALQTNHIPTIAYAHAHRVFFEALRRDRSQAAPHLQALLGLAREHGISVWIAAGTFFEGWLRCGTADCEAGTAEIHQGMELLRLQQVGVYMPMQITLLAETEAEAGRPEAALATINSQLAATERTGQLWYLSEVHRARGKILLECRPGDVAAAEAAFVRAVDISREQSAKLFELQAAASLARLWSDQGKRAEALDLLAPIYSWFTEGFDAPVMKDAKALLNELT
jgi:predicted ATPase